ncbi:hypothetical protein Tco_1046672 [Tanacetum coccineum]
MKKAKPLRMKKRLRKDGENTSLFNAREREGHEEGVGPNRQPHPECYYSRISQAEVRTALRKMGRNKAVGLDQIPIESWRSLGDEGIFWLTSLFNKIFTSAKMPEEWRLSEVIPIFKNKGDAQVCSNYRVLLDVLLCVLACPFPALPASCSYACFMPFVLCVVALLCVSCFSRLLLVLMLVCSRVLSDFCSTALCMAFRLCRMVAFRVCLLVLALPAPCLYACFAPLCFALLLSLSLT